MALFIVASMNGRDNFDNHEWHLGERPPKHLAEYTFVKVQADGDELQHLRDRYPVILNNFRVQRWNGGNWIDEPVMTWYGDIAKFIVGNL